MEGCKSIKRQPGGFSRALGFCSQLPCMSCTLYIPIFWQERGTLQVPKPNQHCPFRCHVIMFKGYIMKCSWMFVRMTWSKVHGDLSTVVGLQSCLGSSQIFMEEGVAWMHRFHLLAAGNHHRISLVLHLCAHVYLWFYKCTHTHTHIYIYICIPKAPGNIYMCCM